MDRLRRIITLFHHRWAVPLVAELSRAEGAKFITLAHRLDASPTAVRQSLDYLIGHGFVVPNPGYGHPLRPEYVLTPAGEAVGGPCERLDGLIAGLGLRDVALRKWPMPVLYAIGHGAERFSDIPRTLGGITDRALSLSLKDLHGAGVILRELLDRRPPAAIYRASRVGARLVPILSDF